MLVNIIKYKLYVETLTAAWPQPIHKLLRDFHKGKHGNIVSDLWRLHFIMLGLVIREKSTTECEKKQ